ncbi:protein trichome birefringence-like 13 [Fagus crenata]
MATRDHHNYTKKVPLFPLLSLLCFTSVFLILSLSRKTSSSTPSHSNHLTFASHQTRSPDPKSCDYSDGAWIYNPDPDPKPTRYDATCKEIFKGWNCISNNKSNALELTKWRWKPRLCDLPPFDPVSFLHKFRDTNIGFVGDSLNRNMFVSLFCTLKRVSGEVKKWRPAGADRGFTFLHYNLTIAYHRTNLLARYGRWSANANGGVLESLGYREGFRVDIDVPEGTWAEAPASMIF